MWIYEIRVMKVFHTYSQVFTSEIEMTQASLPGLLALLDIDFDPAAGDRMSLIDLSAVKHIPSHLALCVFDTGVEDGAKEVFLYSEEVPYRTAFGEADLTENAGRSFSVGDMKSESLLALMLKREPALSERHNDISMSFDELGYWQLWADGNCIRVARLPDPFYKDRRGWVQAEG